MTFEIFVGLMEARVVGGGLAPLLSMLGPAERQQLTRKGPQQAEAGLASWAGRGRGQPLPGRQGRVQGQSLRALAAANPATPTAWARSSWTLSVKDTGFCSGL